MATTIVMDEVQKTVVAILQASATAFGAGSAGDAPDGSNQQFPSAYEIDSAIITTDGEVCTAICMTLGHPYASQFTLETAALTSGSNVTKNVGVIQKVTVLDGLQDEAFTSADVNITDNEVTPTGGTNLITGSKVRLTTGGVLPTGLAVATDYWIIRNGAATIQFASTYYNAGMGIPIDLSAVGSGSSQIILQYVEGNQAMSEGQIIQVQQSAGSYGSARGYVTGYWFVKGNIVYTTSPTCKVTYTDYVSTAAPQAPNSYFWAVVAGAVAHLMKDGGDAEQCAYYLQMYQQMMQSITAGERQVPAISIAALSGGGN